MPSTRRQKAKSGNLREMDFLSDFENTDVILGNENSNSIEQELVNTIKRSTGRNETEAFFQQQGKFIAGK